jgi:hypothetical protein
MSRQDLIVGVVAGILGVLVGVTVGHQVWGPGRQWESELALPTPRSRAVPEGFAPPGLAGEVRDVLLEPDTFGRTERLAAMFEQLGPEAIEAVRDAYDSVLLDQGDVELVLFGEWWAGFDPSAALRWTQQSPNTRHVLPVIRGIMRAWGRSDPLTAIETATNLAPNDTQRRLWIDYVLRGWDESVTDGALSYAESLGAGPERQWALTVLLRRRVLRDGPEAVIEWAEALPERDEAFKLNVYRRVAGAVAEVDADLAVEFAERHMDGPYGKGLPERVGGKWVLRDPEATMRWLSTLPPGEARKSGVMETYRIWLAVDRVAAQAWLPEQPHDGWLDPAVALYARSISLEDPPQALEWAMGIADTDLRNGTVGSIVRKWLLREPGSAEAWLARSGLPDDLVARIRVVPTNRRVKKVLAGEKQPAS